MIGKTNIIQHSVQKSAGHDDGGKQRNGDAQEKIDGESSHHARTKCITKDEQNGARDQRGYVRVADGWPCTSPTQLNCLPKISAVTQLLFQALKYQDVRVHRHTNAEDESRDAWQREHHTQ